MPKDYQSVSISVTEPDVGTFEETGLDKTDILDFKAPWKKNFSPYEASKTVTLQENGWITKTLSLKPCDASIHAALGASYQVRQDGPIENLRKVSKKTVDSFSHVVSKVPQDIDTPIDTKFQAKTFLFAWKQSIGSYTSLKKVGQADMSGKVTVLRQYSSKDKSEIVTYSYQRPAKPSELRKKP